MKEYISKAIKRVAIIGGGPGGVAAARALRNENAFETITIFERNEHNGGTWAYSSERDSKPFVPSTNALEVDTTLSSTQFHSPIYANLHTNLPKSVMCFQDRPFPENTPLFPPHTDVFDYLNNLVKSEDLQSFVRYSTLVEKVEFENDVWKVSVFSKGERYTEEFDALVVATGHYTVPYIPAIPGLAELDVNKRIEIQHARDYRQPQEFANKTILVVGGGFSATDIVRETAPVAKKVYQCIRTETPLSRQAVECYPPNVHQVALVKHIAHSESSSWVELENEQKLEDIDVIVFGTGYLFSFPFFPFQKDNLIKTGQKVFNLDHFMFYKKNPTLCFIGLPIRVVPMPLMQRQCIVMARYWSRKIPYVSHTLAPKEGYVDDGEDNRAEFIMGIDREIQYNEKLGAWAEGHIDPNIEAWESDNLLTGRLTNQWVELRKNALHLRKDYLGY